MKVWTLVPVKILSEMSRVMKFVRLLFASFNLHRIWLAMTIILNAPPGNPF